MMKSVMKEKHLKTQQNIHFMETAKKNAEKKEFAKKNSLLVISGLFFFK
jgi:hypothetical protein